MSAAINNRVRESKPVKHEKPKGQPSKLVNHGAQQQIDLKAHTVQQLYNLAEKYYTDLSRQEGNKLNDLIARVGTKKDRLNLLASEIVNNPERCLEHIEQLGRYCSDGNHNFALQSCKILSNIYQEHIFIDKTQLQTFMDSVEIKIKSDRKSKSVAIVELVGFYLQHNVKHFYGEMIRSIEQLLSSTIVFVKKAAVTLLTELTRHKQLRRMVVGILINKFGDQDMEIVNQVSKSLKNQFYQDLQSSETLLEEAQSFLQRKHLPEKAQFYVINFLNNLNMKFLSESSLTRLFQLFYRFFELLIDKSDQVNTVSSRLFLNSLKGLNKIFAYLKGGSSKARQSIDTKMDKVYTVIHKSTNSKAKIQLLLFLFQGHSHLHGNLPDRYYRSLYDFIFRDDVLHCSLLQIFFDLVLISLKQDQNLNRVLAFIKRLLQLCFNAQSNFIVTCLLMLSRLMQDKPAIGISMKQKENCMADEEDQQTYNMWKREPIYAGAQKTAIWQLTVFTNHHHPTVRKFAEQLIANQEIPFEGGNPLLELSQANFIDKLSLRKEKKSQGWKIKVRKNLSRIRKGKYESLVDKPLEDFQLDEEFIKRYLVKRAEIHRNYKQMQTKDIEEFADQVVEKEMDRLNPKESDSEEQLYESDMDVHEDEQDQNEQFASEEFSDGDLGQQESEQSESKQSSKQFVDVFQEAGDFEQEYPTKRKPINKSKANRRKIHKKNRQVRKIGK